LAGDFLGLNVEKIFDVEDEEEAVIFARFKIFSDGVRLFMGRVFCIDKAFMFIQ